MQRKIMGLPPKKAGIGGGIAGLIIGVATFFGVIGTGAGMLSQYSQLLQNLFTPQSEIADRRVSSLLRYARTGNVGETRLSYLGSKINARAQLRLAERGITVTTQGINGQASKLIYDSKLNTDLLGMSDDRAKAFLSEKYPGQNINRIGPGRYAVDVNGLSVKDRISVVKDVYGSLGHGRLATAINLRTARAYLGLPSWFKPFSRLGAEANARGYSVSGAIRDYAKNRSSKLTAKTATAKAAALDLSNKMGITKGNVAKGLLVQGALCIAKDIAGSIDAANRLNVVIPSMGLAGDAMSLEQTKTGVDTQGDQVNAVANSFTAPDGTTPWDSDLIIDLQGSDGGVTTDPALAASFDEESGSADFEQTLDALGANTLCSTGAQIIGLAVGVVLLVGTGGASAVAQGLGNAAILSVVLGVAAGIAVKALSDDPLVAIAHQGAMGGSIDALGGHELAQTAARAQGSVELTPEQTNTLVEAAQADERQEFMSQSFFARTFSIYDYRSLTARLMQKSVFSPLNNFSKLIGSFFGIGQSFVNLAKSFSPKAYAAAPLSSYSVNGNPIYSFDLALVDNPAYDDSVGLAEDTARTVFDGGNAGHYIDKAMKCFGNTISKVDGKWQALPTADVNATSAAYREANCDDTSDPNWIKTRFFVLDSPFTEAMACYSLSDKQACINSGMEHAATAAAAPAGPGSTTIATGSTQELAKQIMDIVNANGNISFQTAQKQAFFQQVVDTGHQSECGNPVIDPKLLGVILTLSQQYKIVLGVFNNGHNDGGCDGGFHPKGQAIDINGVASLDGSQTTGNRIGDGAAAGFDPEEQAIMKSFYTSAADVLKANGGGGLGQQQCFNGGPPVGDDAGKKLFVFDDACTHLHLDVGQR
ncbi:MAG: hypothetical protein JWM37_222 [Candidatus Saccharibacteria bacterium]|nr:hypothetical protein [Candidatus Saccharibacteria bacterium]